jgi:hypothetical protein
MSIYHTFGTDKELEKNGVWMDVDENTRFLIARIGTVGCAYDKLLKAATKPYRRAIENETIAPELVRKIITETFAKTALMDWRNVKDEEGNDIPFSKENAAKLLADLPDLANDLLEFARDYQNYRKAQLEEDAKNSANA